MEVMEMILDLCI